MCFFYIYSVLYTIEYVFNNLENAKYKISKIRISLALLKDGQAVFTNLEKLYIYRYVFCKGVEANQKIKLDQNKMIKIPQNQYT